MMMIVIVVVVVVVVDDDDDVDDDEWSQKYQTILIYKLHIFRVTDDAKKKKLKKKIPVLVLHLSSSSPDLFSVNSQPLPYSQSQNPSDSPLFHSSSSMLKRKFRCIDV